MLALCCCLKPRLISHGRSLLCLRVWLERGMEVAVKEGL